MIPFKNLEYDNVFITSDLHYCHKNICRGTSVWPDKSVCRDFDTVEEMNETILNNINKMVGKDDLLIINGDLSFGGEQNIPELLYNINCVNLIATYGNHDHKLHNYANNFIMIDHILYLQVGTCKFVVSHFPQMHWHMMDKGSIMLYGHLHGHKDSHLQQYSDLFRTMDVGIDTNNYNPYNIKDIGKLMQSKITKERHV